MSHAQKSSPGVFRTDVQPFKQLDLLEIRVVGEKEPIRIFLDNDLAGVSFGFKIVGEKPTCGQSLSKYIKVGGTMICDLDVQSIYGLADPDELDLLIFAGGQWMESSFAEGDMEKAVDILEGIIIPASERGAELLGRHYVPYRDVARGIEDAAKKRGLSVNDGIKRVIEQPNLELAIREVDTLDHPSLNTLMLLCAFRMQDVPQGSEFMRLQAHVIRKFVEFTWARTGGAHGIEPKNK